MPAIPAPEAALSDGAITLRPTAERDIPEILIAHEDDRHLHERLGERRPPSGAELGRAAERAPEEWAQGTRAALSVTAAGDDTCLGQALLDEIDWAGGRARLRVWLAPGARGRGNGERALALAREWARSELGLAQLDAAIVVPDR
jgi:RimJ/RimL family protein N-acetyltransferase